MSRPNLYDYLKILAIIAMIADHVGFFFFPGLLWLRLVGRIAFPIFLFLVGFSSSYKRRRDLLIGAVIVQIAFLIHGSYYGGLLALNILGGIIAARAFLSWYQKKHTYLLLILFTLIFLVANVYIHNRVDYGGFVLIFPLMGYLFRRQQKHLLINMIYAVVISTIFLITTTPVFGFSNIQMFIIVASFMLLLYVFFLLGQANKRIYLTPKWDISILRVAKNALRIYVIHLVVLIGVKIIFFN